MTSLDGLDMADWEEMQVGSPTPSQIDTGVVWTGSAWAPSPRRLTGLQIIGLYTAAQHARMRRMLFATFPPGHPQAGQLVDPDGLVQRLADATLAMAGTIVVTDPLHVNGTALYRSVGIIESDIEAARIAAGITPEQWAAGVRP